MHFLIIRFSAIGDIVLTSPVVEAIKVNFPHAHISFLTKDQYLEVLADNPYIDKLLPLSKWEQEKNKTYDYIIDLHNNLRSRKISLSLKGKIIRFKKLNIQKWLLVNFKVNKLPEKHIVHRYLNTLAGLNLAKIPNKLQFYINPKNVVDLAALHPTLSNGYNVLVIGATYFTKQIPTDLCVEWIKASNKPVVILGGKSDQKKANEISKSIKCISAVGLFNLQQAASIIQNASKVITADTGLMHIAAAFQVPTVVVWGNTVPEFGMYPFMDENLIYNSQINDLNCRPCSKLGFDSCPKKHFKCMVNQKVTKEALAFLSK